MGHLVIPVDYDNHTSEYVRQYRTLVKNTGDNVIARFSKDGVVVLET